MYDPDSIADEIAKYEFLIEQLRQKIEQLLRKIEELHHSTVFNEEGEIISYADWAA